MFSLPTAIPFIREQQLIREYLDAGLFKDAFEKAQQDNEALLPKEAGGSAAAAPAAEPSERTE